MTAGRALARAGLIVLAGYAVARALGWLRVVVIGTTFGAGRELDAFYAAFRFPDLIMNLVAAGAIASALVPTLAALFVTGRAPRAWRLASTILNLATMVLALFSVVIAVGAPVLVPLVTPGFDPAKTALTVELAQMMALGPLLLALGSIVTSVLNADGRFAASMVAPIAYNVVTIAAALILPRFIGVHGLAVGVVAGAATYLVVQIAPLLRTGFRYERVIDLADPEIKGAALLLVPRAFGLGASQFQLIAATILASGLSVGSVAAFSIAFTVFQIPVGTIGVPLGVVALPALSSSHAVGALREYLRLLTRSLRLMLFVMLPLAALAVVLRTELVTVLFNYGRFDARSIDLTADTLLFLLVGLPADTLNVILGRAFFARGSTWTPVAIAAVELFVMVAVGALTVGTYGLEGIALGFAVGAWLETVLLVTLLRRRVAGFSFTPIAAGFAAFAAAAVLAALAASGAEQLLAPALGDVPKKVAAALQIAVGGSLGMLVYLSACVALRTPELPIVARLLGRALRRGTEA